jgi:hypothetical protein
VTVNNLAVIIKIVFFIGSGSLGAFLYIKSLEKSIDKILSEGAGAFVGIAGFFLRLALCMALFTAVALIGRADGFIAACIGFFAVRFYLIKKRKGDGDVNKSR